MADAHAVGQAGLVGGRKPDTAHRLAGRQLPLAVGLEIAVVAAIAQVEIQTAHCRALSQGQADFGLIALRQQAHVIIQIDLLRRPHRQTQGQQPNDQRQPQSYSHTHSLEKTSTRPENQMVFPILFGHAAFGEHAPGL
ncbi:hypothetical protein D3C87_1790320 [compost metagenome]